MKKSIIEEYSVTLERDPETKELTGERWKTATGLLHGPHGPAYRKWHPQSGEITYEYWAQYGAQHREGDLPAVFSVDPETKVVFDEECLVNGEAHRTSGPSRIIRDPAYGQVIYEEWKQHDVLDRGGDEPAVVERNPVSGIITYSEYWQKGKLHRSSGPAVIRYDGKTGEVLPEEFYLNNQKTLNPKELPNTSP